MDLVTALLAEASARTQKGHPKFYAPFTESESVLLRNHYSEVFNNSRNGRALKNNKEVKIYSTKGTLLADGYSRLVVGDYGLYIECHENQMHLDEIKNLFPTMPNRAVKYIWMVAKDGSKCKVYWQKGTVRYADYRVGMYYFVPSEIVLK